MTPLTTVNFSETHSASNPTSVNKISSEVSKEFQLYLKIQSIPHVQDETAQHKIKEHLFFRLIALNCKNLKHAEIEEDIPLIKNAIANLLIVNSLLIQESDVKENLEATIEIIQKIITIYKLSSSQLQSNTITTKIQQLCKKYLSLYKKGDVIILDSFVTSSSESYIEALKNTKINLQHFISLYEFQTDFFNSAVKNTLTENDIKVFFIKNRLNLYLEKLNSLNEKVLNLSKQLDSMIHQTHVTFEDTLFLSSEFDNISKNMLFPFFEDDHFSLFTSTHPFFPYSDLFPDDDLKEKFETMYSSLLSLIPELVQNKDEALIQFYNTFFINLCHRTLKNSIELLLEQLQEVVMLSAIENNLTLNVKAAIGSLKTFRAMSSIFKEAKIPDFNKNIDQIQSIINTWMRDSNPHNNYTGLLFDQCSWFKIGIKHALSMRLNDKQEAFKKLELMNPKPNDFNYQLAIKACRTKYLEEITSFNKFYKENSKLTIEKIDNFRTNFLKETENAIPLDQPKECTTKGLPILAEPEESQQLVATKESYKQKPLKFNSEKNEPSKINLHKTTESIAEEKEIKKVEDGLYDRGHHLEDPVESKENISQQRLVATKESYKQASLKFNSEKKEPSKIDLHKTTESIAEEKEIKKVEDGDDIGNHLEDPVESKENISQQRFVATKKPYKQKPLKFNSKKKEPSKIDRHKTTESIAEEKEIKEDKYYSTKYRNLLAEALKQGWFIKRITGDHVQLGLTDCPEAGTVTLPKHDNLKRKTVINFLRQIAKGNAIKAQAELKKMQHQSASNSLHKNKHKNSKRKNKKKLT